MSPRLLPLLTAAFLAGVGTLPAAPLGTGFTYQGRLTDGDRPANGVYDFVFTLYRGPSDEVPVASGVLNDDVQVTDGVFTTTIDFGADLFTGEAMWLEVGVRPGEETGDVTLLSPRHHLAATPYAHFAKRAVSADIATTATSALSVSWQAIQGVPPSLLDGDDGVNYAAGSGLALFNGVEFRVQYAGSGEASTVARSDHDHFAQYWRGTNNAPGLEVQNARTGGIGLSGRSDVFGSGFTPAGGAGVFGDSTSGPGVAGFSNTGPGVYGWTSSQNGEVETIVGNNDSTAGRAVVGHARATTGANIGVVGQTSSSGGTGVRGIATAATGTTYGGRFSNASPNGYAVHAVSDRSGAGYFDIDNRSNASTALEARTDGTGLVAKFTSGASSNTVAAVQSVHLGHGDGLAATAGGRGNAGNFLLLSNYTNNSAVNATGIGSARALRAVSLTGEAIRAESNGTAITAKSDVDGTALAIDGGAIRVKGAGANTSTAVFVHQCTSGNVVSSPGGNTITVIDHPMCNNNPNAILFVTPRINLNNFTGYYTYEDFAIAYSSSRNRWVLLNTSILDELGDFDVGDTFNVMVVLR